MRPNARITNEVWRHYVAARTLPDDVLRGPVDRAWRRCDLAGASPLAMNAQELPPLQAQALLQERSDLIEASRPYMHALSQAAGPERHAAMLGDDNAVVLDVVGDAESVHGRQRVPGPGAVLSESHAGANGIGSPLAEGGYIELIGPEHFIEGFHLFTCQGVPINGPDGKTAGVLSTSVRRIEVSDRMREILYCAAKGIEAELMRRRLMADVAQLLASNNDGKLLEELEQDVVQLQGAARLRLEKAVLLARSERQDDAVRLLATATELMRRFQQRSQLWREIASSDIGPPQYLDFAMYLQDIAALLTTESSVRGIELQLHGTDAPMMVFADSRDLRRRIFRAFLHAFEGSSAGRTLRIEAVVNEAIGVASVSFDGSRETALAVPLRPTAIEPEGVRGDLR